MTPNPRRLALAGLPLLLVAGCATLSSWLTPTTTSAVATLASVAAANNSTVATLVTKGQLFCKSASGIVALLTSLGSPTSVIGIAGTVVADGCNLIGAVPVAPPTSVPLDTVPTVTAPAALKVPAQV
jgi:hypothetical protein